MDLKEPFSQRQNRCAHALISWGKNQYSAEFGLGPLKNGLTYPVFPYSSISSLPVTESRYSGEVAMPAVAAAAMAMAMAMADLEAP